ncbi:MAG: sulfite exporter TauE/SafE family protein [Dehalococcoidia bacterium]
MGLAVGTFGTLVGAGGGFVLVPVLLLLYPDRDAEEITSISLAVVCLNAISGATAFGWQKRIDYRSGIAFAAATLPGALLGAYVVGFLPRTLFDAIFALVLGGIGLLLLLRRQAVVHLREPVTGRWGIARRMVTDRSGQTFFYAFDMRRAVLSTAVIGFLSSLLGIGGGVIQVPLMVSALHFPVHIATATSQFVLAFMAGEGTALHLASGVFDWDHGIPEALLLSLGAVPGAQAGAAIARRVPAPVILRLLAASLLLVALRLGLKAAGI